MKSSRQPPRDLSTDSAWRPAYAILSAFEDVATSNRNSHMALAVLFLAALLALARVSYSQKPAEVPTPGRVRHRLADPAWREIIYRYLGSTE